MKKYLIIFATLLSSSALYAQYTEAGKVQYERRENKYAQMDYGDDENSAWMDAVKSQMQKFKSTFFDLSFDTARSIYKPEPVATDDKSFWGGNPATDNTVLTDFNAHRVSADKTIFEKTFRVQDSMRVLQWKIEDEIRTIADYKCRKAVSRICDSVYVVAFYTDDIPVSGGPEMFSGLPGMIMELAIPRLHTVWTATKVELTASKPEDFAMAEKNKQMTENELYEKLKESFSDWGKWAARNIWWSML